jgi:hypothetical protein
MPEGGDDDKPNVSPPNEDGTVDGLIPPKET